MIEFNMILVGSHVLVYDHDMCLLIGGTILPVHKKSTASLIPAIVIADPGWEHIGNAKSCRMAKLLTADGVRFVKLELVHLVQ